MQSQTHRMLDASVALQVDLTWQMAKASLTANNQRILINTNVYKVIGDIGLEELKIRLSEILGNVPVVAYVDRTTEVIHVMRNNAHTMPTINNTESDRAWSRPSTLHPPANPENPVRPKLRAFGKRSKVPRPPNAFILYRQHWHPHYKQYNKHMHNNDISRELGKRWKGESDEIKQKYRLLAKDLQIKHAAQYPTYRYTPRKPGETKRRTTAHKLEKLQEVREIQEPSLVPFIEAPNASLVEPFCPILSTGHSVDFDGFPKFATDFATSSTPPQPVQSKEDGTFVSTLPSSFDNIQVEIDKNYGSYGVDYVDIAGHSFDPAIPRPEAWGLQAGPASSQTDQQSEWESLVDWQDLDDAIDRADDQLKSSLPYTEPIHR